MQRTFGSMTKRILWNSWWNSRWRTSSPSIASGLKGFICGDNFLINFPLVLKHCGDLVQSRLSVFTHCYCFYRCKIFNINLRICCSRCIYILPSFLGSPSAWGEVRQVASAVDCRRGRERGRFKALLILRLLPTPSSLPWTYSTFTYCLLKARENIILGEGKSGPLFNSTPHLQVVVPSSSSPTTIPIPV